MCIGKEVTMTSSQTAATSRMRHWEEPGPGKPQALHRTHSSKHLQNYMQDFKETFVCHKVMLSNYKTVYIL